MHLLGFRIGALLAWQAAQGRGDMAGLVLFAPPASGRLFLRELKMAAIKLSRDADQEQPDLLESGGYAMPADFQSALSALSFDPRSLDVAASSTAPVIEAGASRAR